MTDPPSILIAGVGNIFLGDDAFGVEVAQRLLRQSWPSNVRVVDFGIRGLDLTYALLEPYDAVILVDAAPRGHPPGTLSVIKPDPPDAVTPDATSGIVAIDTHSMDPVKILRLVRMMGGDIGNLFIVACEPSLRAAGEDGDEMSMGLSTHVAAAVDEGIRLITSLVERLVSTASDAAGTQIAKYNATRSKTHA